MRRKIYVLSLCVALIPSALVAQTQPRTFWRGVFLFGLDSAQNRVQFFSALVDSLHLNVFQVTTFEGAYLRNNYFLTPPKKLQVIVQENALVSKLSAVPRGSPEHQKLRAKAYDDKLKKQFKTLRAYPSVIRFYLRDEPSPESFEAWRYVRDLIAVGDTKTRTVGSVAAYADTGAQIGTFLAVARPSELVIDPYYIFNTIPHPSLEGRPEIARAAGIRAWEDYEPKDRYGYYFGFLQLYLNQALQERIRPAAEAAGSSSARPPLVLVPQLHGVLHRSTGLYDTDNNPDVSPNLRPPSPAEIRLQFGIGIAYGAKGFLAYPYGTQYGKEPSGGEEAYVGLVPPRERDASLVRHSSNFETIFGKEVWTGYQEKWDEVATLYRRFSAGLGDTLLRLTWIGAKSWTHRDSASVWVPTTVATKKWNPAVVLSCKTVTTKRYQDNLPQVEVGYLKRGAATYLAVVNRRCYPFELTRIIISLSSSSRWRVTNIEHPSARWDVEQSGSFSDTFEPGAFKVYRLDSSVLSQI